MTYVSSVGHAPPKLHHHCLSRKIPPGPRNIAFITALVIYNRFLVFQSEITSMISVLILYAGVCNEWVGMVIENITIVNSYHVMKLVFRCKLRNIVIPVTHLFCLHEVILVGHTPPYVFISGKTCYDVVDIHILCHTIQLAESPSVIWMKNYEIGLYTQIIKLFNTFFNVAEESRIQAGIIPVFQSFSFKRIQLGLIDVPVITFGKYTHTHLVEVTLR